MEKYRVVGDFTLCIFYHTKKNIPSNLYKMGG